MASVALGAAALLAPSTAAAQEAEPGANGEVVATGKGIAGGVMLGAEVGLITMGAIGVKDWWAYLIAGAVGGGGGAVGGYFVEQVDPPAEPSLYMLAGGLALIIPTVVVVANATAYDPTEDREEDEEVSEESPDATIQVDASLPRIPMALFDLDASDGDVVARPGFPAVGVGPDYTRREVATYGVEQTTVVHVPVISGRF